MLTYWAPGKLLISGEYAILDGSWALAVPTKMGQGATVAKETGNETSIHWTAKYKDSVLMDAIFFIDQDRVEIIENQKFSLDFKQILHQVILLNPEILHSKISYRITTELDFHSEYGLGSSSTLTVLLSKIFNICPYRLNELTFKSSGYDIAVGEEKSSILYQKSASVGRKPLIRKINFSPEFTSELLFIYLNQKMNSRDAISGYRSQENPPELIEKISSISQDLLFTKDINSFSDYMEEHESCMSSLLKTPKVKDVLFPDIPVFVKSLGAWGGDFVMSRKFDGYQDYFTSKGYHTVIPWEEMVYDENQSRY